MNCLVTGGAGFVGSHLVDRLVDCNHHVTVVDNLSTGRMANVHKAAHLYVEDILAATQRLKGQDALFHFQAHADLRHGKEAFDVDVHQNLNPIPTIAQAAGKAGIKTVVFASSSAVYGYPDVFPTPESYSAPQRCIYGANKLAGEAIFQACAEYYGFDLYILRFVSMLGPRYHHGCIVDFVNRFRESGNLKLCGGLDVKKSFLHVQDAIDAVVELLAVRKPGIYNVGHEEETTVGQVAKWVASEMGIGRWEIEATEGRSWPGDAERVLLDTSKLCEVTNWMPRYSIEQAVRETVRCVST